MTFDDAVFIVVLYSRIYTCPNRTISNTVVTSLIYMFPRLHNFAIYSLDRSTVHVDVDYTVAHHHHHSLSAGLMSVFLLGFYETHVTPENECLPN